METAGNSRNSEDETFQLPQALVSTLKRRRTAAIFVPPTVDETILRTARRHLAHEAAPRFGWPMLIRWGVATAVLALLLAIIPHQLRRPGPAPGLNLSRLDINRDGQVDILDAFALAREPKTGGRPDPRLDVNGDGTVDERDVAVIAAQAVSLEKGGRS